MILELTLLILLIVLDQGTKFIVANNMEVLQSLPVIENFFHITYAQNRGIAFSMFDGKIAILGIVGLIAIIVLFFYYFKNRKTNTKLNNFTIIFIIAGAIGNTWDRVFRGDSLFNGYVVDFFDFNGIWNAIFNVADVYINIAVGLYILAYILELKNKKVSLTVEK